MTLARLRVAVPIAVPFIVLLVFVVRGCSTPNVPLLRPPPGVTLPAADATSVPQDLTGIRLAGVDGTTTLVPARAAGTAHMSGSVNGPQGPVPGVTVRVEHLVVGQPPPIDVVTGPDGRWDLPNIAGGRYRVRAFMVPSLAQTEPQILFLDDGDQTNLDLNVESFAGPVLAAAVAPDPPLFNQSFTLVVRVARKTVDADGVVRSEPIVSASVTLTDTPGYTVQSANGVPTDANGDATFTLQCRTAGASSVQVAVRPTATDTNQPVTLPLPACVDSGAPPPSSSGGGSSGGPSTTAGPQPN